MSVYQILTDTRLSTNSHVKQYITEKDIEEIQYISFLLMARAGIRALEFYDPAAKKHLQAHMQVKFLER